MRLLGPRATFSSEIAVAEVPAGSRRAISFLLTLIYALVLSACATAQADASGQLKLKPDILQFGSIAVGKTYVISVTVYNTGNAAATMSGEALTGAGYSVAGLALPKTLNAGATTTFTVKFTPTKAGALNGQLTLLSNAGNSTFVVPLYGTGTASASSGHVSTSVASLQFKGVTVGAKSAQTVQLKNDGPVTITVNGLTVSGSGFSVSGLTTPLTLASGATAQFSAGFQPTKSGSYSGSLAVSSTAADSNIMVTLSGTAVASTATGHISSSLANAAFGSVPVGTKNTQSIQLKNDGTVSITLTAVAPSGTGFSVSGITPPVTLAPGATTQFAAGFQPGAAGNFSGSVRIASTAADSSIMVTLSGTGVSGSKVLNVSPASIAFGNVNLSSTGTHQITLTNGGNSSITISGDSVTGTGLSATSVNGTTLAAGQSTTITAEFAPKTAGSVSGSLKITSNATNAAITVPLTGTGVSGSHMVALSWTASTSSGVAGYNVYRSTVSGGSYSKLTGSPIAGTAYSDSTVASGTQYYYVLTSVGTNGTESGYSTQVAVKVP